MKRGVQCLIDDDLDLNDKIVLQINSVTNIHNGLKELGMNRKVVELSDKAVQSTLENLKKDNDLLKLLESFGEEENFIYELGVLTAYIATALASQTMWSGEEKLNDLAAAAILKDISLQNPVLAKILFFNDPVFKNLTDSEMLEVKNHPEVSAEKLEFNSAISSRIKNLIRDHHEMPSGNGFPEKVDANSLPEMTCLFILAHYYAQNLLKFPPSEESLIQIDLTIEEAFSSGNFKNPFEVYRKVFGKSY